MKFADLHLHTYFSDGTFSPEELVGHGHRLGFAALALDGPRFGRGLSRAWRRRARRRALISSPAPNSPPNTTTRKFICSAISWTRKTKNCCRTSPSFRPSGRIASTKWSRCINGLNVPLKAESVFALANCKSPGRPHVARALVKAGLVGSLDEAFERFLKKNRPAWVPKAKMSALEAIELIHQAGGLAVMAHPGLNRTDDVIPVLVEAGLDGIECFHTKHSTVTSERYLEMADKYHLLVTGGSDCHGFSKGKPLIGTVKLPYEHVEKLKSRVESRRSKAGTAATTAIDSRHSSLDT